MPYDKDGNLGNVMMLGTLTAAESILEMHIMPNVP